LKRGNKSKRGRGIPVRRTKEKPAGARQAQLEKKTQEDWGNKGGYCPNGNRSEKWLSPVMPEFSGREVEVSQACGKTVKGGKGCQNKVKKKEVLREGEVSTKTYSKGEMKKNEEKALKKNRG